MIPDGSGRIANPITMTVVRELTSDDIFRLVSEPITVSAPPLLQKLTSSHHAMARLVASGKSATQIAILCNKTPQRVRDLTKDPAFKELVAVYQEQISAAEITDEVRLREKARNIAEMALDEISERMEDDDKRAKIPFAELRQVAGDTLDRTVLPKKTAVSASIPPQNITFNIAGNGPVRETKQLDSPIIEGELTSDKPKPD